MKKEEQIKKNLILSLKGFPIGVMALVLAYIGVYFIGGNDIFKIEICQIQNVYTLIYQSISLGIGYYILTYIYYAILYKSCKELKDIRKHTYVSIVTIFVGAILYSIFGANEKIFSQNIILMNVIIIFQISIIIAIIAIIKAIKESKVIKKINDKIKERNK